jgi:ketosteroid isomerase-like protein
VSQENVDLLRSNNDAYRRGDWETVTANLDPHVFVRTDPRWPEQFIYGREAWVANLQAMWESVGPDAHIEEIVDLGDRVLVRLGFSMRGQQSGIQGDQPVSEIATVRGGRIILVEYFLDHDQALKAVGLSE